MILLASVFILPRIVHEIAAVKSSSLETRGTKQAAALGSAFGLAAIAASVGLNPIVGAFAAGMGLAGSKLVTQVREFIGRIKVIVELLFFSIIGAHVSFNQIQDIDWLFFGIILTIAVVSKIGGCGIPDAIMLRDRTKGLRIGYGMIARGEVAFIIAGIGLSVGVINDQIYSTMIVVVLATIFIASTMLRLSYGKNNH